MIDFNEYSSILRRVSELETLIKALNSYDNYLREKYYGVMQYSIKLLVQYRHELKSMEKEVEK